MYIVHMMIDTTQPIQIVEVGPRDGLQNDPAILTTSQKVDLIMRLADTGLNRIEVASFVHPDRVPQMADAEAIFETLPQREDVSYIGLVVNWRGWRRATDTAVDEINMNISASNTFSLQNQGTHTDDSLNELSQIVLDARDQGIPVTATIATAWGCPLEGEVPIERLLFVAGAAAAAGVTEVILADTIGVADPWSVTERINYVRRVTKDTPLRVHFHNTRNTGMANTYAAIMAGITTIDSSIGGIGGCPFAPGATGNIATEDLIYMLERAGFSTGVSLDAAIDVSRHIETLIEGPIEAMLPRTGGFPTGSSPR